MKVIYKNKRLNSAELSKYLRDLPDNSVLNLDIRLEGEKRSINQNDRYWKLIELASDTSGYTKFEFHDLMRYKFLPIVIKTIEGNEFKELSSTTSLTKKEFTSYMQEVESYIAKLFSITLPYDY